MKDQTIITLGILSLFTMVVPSASADTYSVTTTTTTKERAPTTHVYTSMKEGRATVNEVSDAPLYDESLNKDDIIEKHKHRHLRTAITHGDWL